MADLAATGMTPDQIALVMELSAAVSAEARPVTDEAADRRRERDREYQAQKRAERRQMSADSSDATDTSSLSLPPNENNSNPLTHTHGNISRARKADPFPCPGGVDPVDWDGLKANRKAKRAALSPGAHRQITNKLDMWARDGWPPGPIVAHAVERGWTTVFETDEMKAPRNEHRNGSKPSTGKVDGFTAVLREVARREHEPPGALNG